MPSSAQPGQPAADNPERAIKRRLLERVADADATHLTIDAAQGSWQPFLRGVQIKALYQAGGVLSYLLKLAPGACLPPHRHIIDEECLVLEGTLRVGTHTQVHAGGFHLAHGGALHATVRTDTGATIFLRGAVPHAGDVLV